MAQFLLDTNMVSHILRRNPIVMERINALHYSDMAISILTHAEIKYGFAKNPQATKMQRLFDEFVLNIQILPFDETVSVHYGQFKANTEKQGKSLAPLDMLIAAHASAIGAVLVSNDQAFQQITDLQVQDWTKA